MCKKLHFCPVPRTVDYCEGTYVLNIAGIISIDSQELMESILIAKSSYLSTMQIQILNNKSQNTCISFKRSKFSSDEGYGLDIDSNGVVISYSTKTGAFWGMMTLNQMVKECSTTLPYIHITDSPDFSVRGYMLDVARCRIPKIETIYRLIDLLASLKYNQLQLYMEGVPFEYPSFPNMCACKELLTGEELYKIDRYCSERMIELVPCQNHFGHMATWVEKEYNHLAECPNGFDDGPWGWKDPAVLDPNDDGSLELVTRMADDLLPYFSSKQYNINCDETNELGRGKSKEICNKLGCGRVYFNYILKLYNMAKERGKTIMLWGDIIKKYPKLLPELPSDVTLLEWGYNDDEPKEENCKLMHDLGVKYIVCPGTNTWNSIIGRNVTMINNIRTAAVNGMKYGAIGILCTDWGDNGHFQPISVSYAGMVWSAMNSWNCKGSDEKEIASVLNIHIFEDSNGIMGQLALDAGSYNLKEYQKCFNITVTMNKLLHHINELDKMGDINSSSFENVIQHFSDIKKKLCKAKLNCIDADLIFEEFNIAIDMTSWAQLLGLYYIASKSNDQKLMRTYLTQFVSEGRNIFSRYRVCWLKRNKYSYLDESLKKLENLCKEAEDIISNLNKDKPN